MLAQCSLVWSLISCIQASRNKHMAKSFRKNVRYSQFQSVAEPQDLSSSKTFTFIILQVCLHCAKRNSTEFSYSLSSRAQATSPLQAAGMTRYLALQKQISQQTESVHLESICCLKHHSNCAPLAGIPAAQTFGIYWESPLRAGARMPRGRVLENPFELPSWALFSGCTAGILFGQVPQLLSCGWRGHPPVLSEHLQFLPLASCCLSEKKS